jgi:hypothetical protein
MCLEMFRSNRSRTPKLFFEATSLFALGSRALATTAMKCLFQESLLVSIHMHQLERLGSLPAASCVKVDHENCFVCAAIDLRKDNRGDLWRILRIAVCQPQISANLISHMIIH